MLATSSLATHTIPSSTSPALIFRAAVPKSFVWPASNKSSAVAGCGRWPHSNRASHGKWHFIRSPFTSAKQVRPPSCAGCAGPMNWMLLSITCDLEFCLLSKKACRCGMVAFNVQDREASDYSLNCRVPIDEINDLVGAKCRIGFRCVQTPKGTVSQGRTRYEPKRGPSPTIGRLAFWKMQPRRVRGFALSAIVGRRPSNCPVFWTRPCCELLF